MSTPNAIAKAFDTFNRVRLQSTILEEIWQEAYGQEYAADAKPDAFYPLSVLDKIIATGGSHVSGRALLDVGCGHGMTGLYLAQHLDMKLFGIDVSPASIELAQKNALNRGLSTHFWVAEASSTKLEDGTCAIVTCLDVLLYVPDKPSFFAEVYRILEPGSLFAFTTWEQKGYNARLGAQQVEDHRPLLKDAGFNVEYYEVVEGASEQQMRVFDGLTSRQDALREELGAEAASMFASMAKSAREESSQRRYVFGMARRGDV